MYLVTYTLLNLVEDILSHRMKGYKQINVKFANNLYRRPVDLYESDFSMINKAHVMNLMLLMSLDLKNLGIFH